MKYEMKKTLVERKYLTEIPHEKEELSIQWPFFRGYLPNVLTDINKDALRRPKPTQTASVLHHAFENLNQEYGQKIKNIFKEVGLFEFVGNLYLPKSRKEQVSNGIILDLNPEFKEGKLIMEKDSLIQRLNEDDKNVKFIPFGFKNQDLGVREFLHHPYINAMYGDEGTEKILEVALKNSFENSDPTYALWVPNAFRKGMQPEGIAITGGRYYGCGLMLKTTSTNSDLYYGMGIKEQFS